MASKRLLMSVMSVVKFVMICFNLVFRINTVH